MSRPFVSSEKKRRKKMVVKQQTRWTWTEIFDMLNLGSRQLAASKWEAGRFEPLIY